MDQARRLALAAAGRRALPEVVAATRARRAARRRGRGPGTCTASKPAGSSATGTGPHKVTVETNSDPGISEGTIFRPSDLGGAEKYPIFVWGEGGCSKNGLSNAAAMAEIASHGYFVVADGTPNGTGNRPQDRSMLKAMAAPLLAYVDWAIAENDKPCSAYYHSLAPTKISANGFSCGGLMSQATVLDPRIVTWGVNSSGMAGADQAYYDMIKTPVLFVEGGSGDIAYDGGLEGYTAISKLNVPVLWLSKALGARRRSVCGPRGRLHQDRSRLAQLVVEGGRDGHGQGLARRRRVSLLQRQRLGIQVHEHPVAARSR